MMAPVATDTSAPRKPETNRLQYLDALRGIAALMMVFFHFVLPPTTNFGESG